MRPSPCPRPRALPLALALALVAGAGCGSSGGNVDVRPDARADRDPGEDLRPDGPPDDATTDAPDGGDGGGGDGLTVETESGPVRGTVAGKTRVFLGIPYAAPPTGERRWQPPVAPEPWEMLDATRRGPVCPQLQFGTLNVSPVSDEDCLQLNVWTPAGAGERAPVMVWLHGGAFVLGSGTDAMYDGQKLAEATGHVIITVNYRLGPLGFLVSPALDAENPERATSGNYGLLDQRAALRWVQRNVAAFGGDPGNVTLFGESAGGISVCMHLVMPESRGLFHRALISSGPCILATSRTYAESLGGRVATALGCEQKDAAAQRACLREKSVEEVLRAVPQGLPLLSQEASWGPVVDGVELPAPPEELLAAGKGAEVPLLIGSNRDEGTFFLPTVPIPDEQAYEQLVRTTLPTIADDVLAEYPAADYESPKAAAAAVLGDAVFVCPSRRVARAVSAQGNPTFLYAFNHALQVPIFGDLGAFHGSDIPFVFGNGFAGTMLSDEELPLSEAIMGYWGRFAATGNPNGGGAVEWPAYDAKGDAHLDLDLSITAGSGRSREKCDFWDAHVVPVP